MKSYTDLEQSKKLVEILPIESADYHYIVQGENSYHYSYSLLNDAIEQYNGDIKYIPCWSLAALLSALPFHIIAHNQRYVFGMFKGLNKDGETYSLTYSVYNTKIFLHRTDYYNNPVDACVIMIDKLHKQNLI